MRRPARALWSLALLTAITPLVLSATDSTALASGTAKTVTLKPNSSQTVSYPAFTPPGNLDAYATSQLAAHGVREPNETPAQCAADKNECLTVPIKLSITKKQLLHDTLALGITCTYDDPVDAYVPVVGADEEGQTIRVYLWQENPPKDKNGDPTYDAYDDANDPGYISAGQVQTTNFFLVIIPSRSLGKPFTIKYNFQDITGAFGSPTTMPISMGGVSSPSTGTGSGTSGSSTAPVTTSTVPTTIAGGVTPVGGAIETSVPSIAGAPAASFAVPNIASGVADPALVTAAQISVPFRLGVSGSTKITGATSSAATRVKDSSASLVLIELLVLPVLAVIGTLWVLARRRRRDRRVSGFDGTALA